MKQLYRVVVLAFLFTAPLFAKDPDSRLGTAKTAFVQAGDEFTDDKPIALCLSEHLAKTTPLTPVESKEVADVVLKVYKADIAGDTSRGLLGFMGLVHMDVLAVDGSKLFNAYVNLSQQSKLDMRPVSEVPCMLADALADKLRQGMRKARDKK